MDPKGSLPHSQGPATLPYSEPDQSSLCPHPTSWRYIFNVFCPLRLGRPSGLFISGFPTKTPYSTVLTLYTCYV